MPALGFRGTLRFILDQLTSMRTALMLLLLLAVAAVPDRYSRSGAGADIVETWIEDNPTLGPILDVLGMFDVYNSVWFSAVYLLLMVSLVGCLWPRGLQHLKPLRQPPAARHVICNGCPNMANSSWKPTDPPRTKPWSMPNAS